jgi:chromosomal replication initiation ATPase DnaA
MTRQLPLPFDDEPRYAAAEFCAAPSNELARKFLAAPGSWTNGRLVLWGEGGCGKSHLLHVWAAERGAAVVRGPFLRGFEAPPAGPVAVDDADAAPEPAALMHLLNAAAEARQPVLLTARMPPARQAIELPDLASRLRASLAVQILPPDDELLSSLLSRLALARQLVLNLPVRNFLLTRLPRTPAALREAVARLDRASLAAGGKISRQLAAGLLEDLAVEDTKEASSSFFEKKEPKKRLLAGGCGDLGGTSPSQ